jgi:hypothetical protein
LRAVWWVRFTGERTHQGVDDEQGGGRLIDECRTWLSDFLHDKGTTASNEIIDAAGEAGFKRNMVHEAKKRLKVRARRSGFGGEGGWVWYL